MSEHPHSEKRSAGDWSNVHPDFDGHLEKPLAEMTTTEKLEWLWEMMQFQHWVKTQVRREEAGRNSPQRRRERRKSDEKEYEEE